MIKEHGCVATVLRDGANSKVPEHRTGHQDHSHYHPHYLMFSFFFWQGRNGGGGGGGGSGGGVGWKINRKRRIKASRQGLEGRTNGAPHKAGP